MRNIAGGATRGDLEWFVDPLKKFMTRTIHAKRLLEEALASIDAGPAVGPDVKARFLKSIAVYVDLTCHSFHTLTMFRSQGTGTVKKVVTNFWSQCRGIDINYAP